MAKFKNDTDSSFTPSIDKTTFNRDQIAINPYLWLNTLEKNAFLSYSYMSFLDKNINIIKPMYNYSNQENIKDLFKQGKPIPGVNTRLGIIKYMYVDPQDTRKQEQYKRNDYTSQVISLPSVPDMGPSGQEYSDNLMIASNFQFAIFNFLLLLQEMLDRASEPSFNINDKLMTLYLIDNICPEFTSVDKPDKSQDYFVKYDQYGKVEDYYAVKDVSNPYISDIRNLLLDALCGLGKSKASNGFLLQKFYDSNGKLISLSKEEQKVKTFETHTDIIEYACNWLMTKLDSFRLNNLYYKDVSMIRQLESVNFVNIFKQDIQDKYCFDTKVSCSMNLRMLLDISSTAIAKHNNFMFQNRHIIQGFKSIEFLRKKVAINNDISELQRLIVNDFSYAKVLISTCLNEMFSLIKFSNVIKLDKNDGVDIPSRPSVNPLFRKANGALYLLVDRLSFERVYTNKSKSPLLLLEADDLNLKPTQVDKSKEEVTRDSVIKSKDALLKSIVETLDNTPDDDFMKTAVMLESLIQIFNQMEINYSKLYQKIGKLTFGHDGISMVLSILRLKDKLRQIPGIGNIFDQAPSVDAFVANFLQLESKMLNIFNRLTPIRDEIKKNLNTVIVTETSLKNKEYIVQSLSNSLGENVNLIEKIDEILNNINQIKKESKLIKDDSKLLTDGTLNGFPNLHTRGLGSPAIVIGTVVISAQAMAIIYSIIVLVIGVGAVLTIIFRFADVIEAWLVGLTPGSGAIYLKDKQLQDRIDQNLAKINNPNIDTKAKEILVAETNQLLAIQKGVNQLHLTALDIQMRKPSIFDAPGILAVNAAYVAVGLFAVWGATKIYLTAKHTKMGSNNQANLPPSVVKTTAEPQAIAHKEQPITKANSKSNKNITDKANTNKK